MKHPPHNSFHRELKSRPELLENLVDDVDRYLRSRLDDEDLVYRVVLLVSEAATNAMEHGNRYDVEKRVVVNIEVGQRDIVAQVCDEGEGFVPDAVDDPLRDENLLRTGGRGLFLIRSLADEVGFDADGKCVRIVVRRN